jgi:hypothetical protein
MSCRENPYEPLPKLPDPQFFVGFFIFVFIPLFNRRRRVPDAKIIFGQRSGSGGRRPAHGTC